ncbi:MAG TPA: acyltransferase [Puia sp.]|jgi:fucose 4-O-acetylase-like acetyltransferase
MIPALKNWLSRVFNTSILRKNRMQWVDYLRGIAILLVVYRHVLLGLQHAGIFIQPWLVEANIMFYSFRMPLFFILSGIFINGSLKKNGLRKVVFNKFENLLYPYLVWSVIQITLQILTARYNNSHRSLIDYTYILYQPRALDQFWYLPALFNATFVYLIIKTKLKASPWSQLALGIVLYFLSPYCRSISLLSDFMEFYLFFAIGDAISETFFLAKAQSFFKNIRSLLLMLPFFIVAQLYYISHDPISTPAFLAIALISCLTMFIFAFQLQDWKILSFLRVLGYHSLYIYVMHVIIAAVVRVFFIRVLGITEPNILLFTGILLSVTIPVIIYNLFIYKKPLWFLFSLKKKEERPAPATTIPSAAIPGGSLQQDKKDRS